jgi:hypothetical protein
VLCEWVRSQAIERRLDSCIPSANGASGVSPLTSAQHGRGPSRAVVLLEHARRHCINAPPHAPRGVLERLAVLHELISDLISDLISLSDKIRYLSYLISKIRILSYLISIRPGSILSIYRSDKIR